jgi:hypothetical protein
MKKCIIGNGGFGREVHHSMTKKEQSNTVFFVDDEYYNREDFNTLPLSKFDKKKHNQDLELPYPDLSKFEVYTK